MASLSISFLNKLVYTLTRNANKTISLHANKIYHNTYTTVIPQLNFIHLDDVTYEKICSETLESLTEYFDELLEKDTHLISADVSYGDGVLTVDFGNNYGIYVINRQSPNKQIWLSSPLTGPKRYDFAGDSINKGCWIYRHSGESMHQLLQNEIKNIIGHNVNFFKLPYSGKF